MPQRKPPLDRAQIEAATRKIVEIIEDGLEHGHFECLITGEIANATTRRLTVRSGKSYRFNINAVKEPEDYHQ